MRIDGRGMRDKSKKLISDFLQRHPKDKHILIAAATDTSALGAVDAVREQKREKHVAIVGQDCIAEAIAEMKKDGSPLIGSVSHEASSYGPSLIHLGLSLLRGQTVPPYNYVDHKMVDAGVVAVRSKAPGSIGIRSEMVFSLEIVAVLMLPVE